MTGSHDELGVAAPARGMTMALDAARAPAALTALRPTVAVGLLAPVLLVLLAFVAQLERRRRSRRTNKPSAAELEAARFEG
jgi:hypothetical protein